MSIHEFRCVCQVPRMSTCRCLCMHVSHNVCACIHLCFSMPHSCKYLQISEGVGFPGIAATENCSPVDMGAVNPAWLSCKRAQCFLT